VVNRDGKLSIAIRSDILFASGAAQLSAEAEPVIRQLGRVLREFPVNIRIEGHTDNVPVSGGPYPSNWELSAARSVSVVHLLVAEGVAPERLSAVGYGEFHPVVPNATPDGRNANRRVVMTVESGDPEADPSAAGGQQ
jgi:chemotaxis protein MotB